MYSPRLPEACDAGGGGVNPAGVTLASSMVPVETLGLGVTFASSMVGMEALGRGVPLALDRGAVIEGDMDAADAVAVLRSVGGTGVSSTVPPCTGIGVAPRTLCRALRKASAD